MNDKGQYFFIWIIIALSALAFGILALMLSNPITEMVGSLTNDTGIDDNNSIAFVEDVRTSTPAMIDNLAFWFMIAVVGSLLIFGLYVKWHPALIIIGFIALIIMIFLAAQYSNIYDEIKSDAQVTNAEQHTLSNIIFGRQFPIIIGVVAALVLAIVFRKKGDVESI